MKVRSDFVTNSSSSSFIISKKYLDAEQCEAIRSHSSLGEKLGFCWCEYAWDIDEDAEYITGYTYMDNFDMYEFLEKIDVDMNRVDWSEFDFDLDTYSKDKNKTWRDLLYED